MSIQADQLSANTDAVLYVVTCSDVCALHTAFIRSLALVWESSLDLNVLSKPISALVFCTTYLLYCNNCILINVILLKKVSNTSGLLQKRFIALERS